MVRFRNRRAGEAESEVAPRPARHSRGPATSRCLASSPVAPPSPTSIFSSLPLRCRRGLRANLPPTAGTNHQSRGKCRHKKSEHAGRRTHTVSSTASSCAVRGKLSDLEVQRNTNRIRQKGTGESRAGAAATRTKGGSGVTTRRVVGGFCSGSAAQGSCGTCVWVSGVTLSVHRAEQSGNGPAADAPVGTRGGHGRGSA